MSLARYDNDLLIRKNTASVHQRKIIEPLQESVNTVRREHVKFSKLHEFEGNILGKKSEGNEDSKVTTDICLARWGYKFPFSLQNNVYIFLLFNMTYQGTLK